MPCFVTFPIFSIVAFRITSTAEGFSPTKVKRSSKFLDAARMVLKGCLIKGTTSSLPSCSPSGSGEGPHSKGSDSFQFSLPEKYTFPPEIHFYDSSIVIFHMGLLRTDVSCSSPLIVLIHFSGAVKNSGSAAVGGSATDPLLLSFVNAGFSRNCK